MSIDDIKRELEAENRQNILEAYEDMERIVLKRVQKQQILTNKLQKAMEDEKEVVETTETAEATETDQPQ